MTTEIILKLEHIEKRFGNLKVLDDINLEVHKGEIVSIIGQSGGGKTTLLRLVAQLDSPTSGQIHRSYPFMTDYGFIFQRLYVFPWLTVEQNIRFGLANTIDDAFVSDILEKVGLSAYRNYYPSQISGGMEQRVAVARAIVRKPKILLMDEAFSDLDVGNKKKMYSIVYDLNTTIGTSFILVTHDIREAIQVSDTVLLLSPRPSSVAYRYYPKQWQSEDLLNEIVAKLALKY